MNRSVFFVLLATLFLGGLGADGQPLTLTFVHVNDTHSHFDPAQAKLTVDLDGTLKGKILTVELGGFPQAASVIADLRKSAVNPVVLHAGDFFQGTLYFTQSSGVADIDFWNSVGLDAATVGNHEFDLGAVVLRKNFLERANFPVVSANLDWSRNTVLAPVSRHPWVVKVIGGEKVGFFGLTTTDTPFISSPGPDVAFLGYAESARQAVKELHEQGVDKIVAITHIGYDEDLKLASEVPGIDVIIGGHSHTLLGDWAAYGLKVGGPYPTVVHGPSGTVLVVQSWEWAKVIGDLRVDFDAAGKVVSWKASPVAVVGARWFRLAEVPGADGQPRKVEFDGDLGGTPGVKEFDGKTWAPVPADEAAFDQVYAKRILAWFGTHPDLRLSLPDPAAEVLAKAYAGKVEEMRALKAADVAVDLIRGLNTGPGPIVAESYAAKTGAQVALSNPGGIRTDLLAGPLTVAGVYELIPFGNTLVTLKVTGDQLTAILEDSVENSLTRGETSGDNPLVYAAGIRFTVNTGASKGHRISHIEVKGAGGRYAALDPGTKYSLVVNNFMAAGGDRYDTLKLIPGKVDTGFIDAEALLDYVKGKALGNGEQRIILAR